MKYKNQSILFVVLFATMAAFAIKMMIGMTYIFDEIPIPDFLNRGALLFYIIIISILPFFHKLDSSSIGFGTIQYLIIFSVINILLELTGDKSISISEAFYHIFPLIFAIFTYVIAYNLYLKYPHDDSFLQYIAIFITTSLCIGYIILANGLRFNYSSVRLGIAYIPLIFSPLLFLNKNKFSWLPFFLIAYVLIDSGKRGGFIALLFGILLYWGFISRKFSNSKKIRIIFLLIALLLIFGNFISEYVFNTEMFDRLLHGSDGSDYSSGRVSLYEDVLNNFWESDSGGMIFGHGLGSVSSVTKQGMTAHNDFLEALYDFGIIGFMSYMLSYLCFIIQFNRTPKRDANIKGVFAYAFTVILLLSTLSQIFIYQYLGLVTFVIGAISGSYKQQLLEKRKKII